MQRANWSAGSAADALVLALPEDPQPAIETPQTSASNAPPWRIAGLTQGTGKPRPPA
jgi:hypothetical protein